jgi:hypothetical protein
MINIDTKNHGPSLKAVMYLYTVSVVFSISTMFNYDFWFPALMIALLSIIRLSHLIIIAYGKMFLTACVCYCAEEAYMYWFYVVTMTRISLNKNLGRIKK